MSSWLLIHETGRRYRVVNNSGAAAHDVHFSIEGAMVATTMGTRNWTKSVNEIPNGDWISEVFAQAMGPAGHVIVEWSDPDGSRLRDALPLR